MYLVKYGLYNHESPQDGPTRDPRTPVSGRPILPYLVGQRAGRQPTISPPRAPRQDPGSSPFRLLSAPISTDTPLPYRNGVDTEVIWYLGAQTECIRCSEPVWEPLGILLQRRERSRDGLHAPRHPLQSAATGIHYILPSAKKNAVAVCFALSVPSPAVPSSLGVSVVVTTVLSGCVFVLRVCSGLVVFVM